MGRGFGVRLFLRVREIVFFVKGLSLVAGVIMFFATFKGWLNSSILLRSGN